MPIQHVVREFGVDLADLGLGSATLNNILSPKFWVVGCQHLKPGDELRVKGPLVAATLRVVTSSEDGVVVEQIAGGAVDLGTRNLIVCRTEDRWTAVWALSPRDMPFGCYGPETKWQEFASGQRSLPAIIALVADELAKGPVNVTMRSTSLETLKTGNGYLDPALAPMTGGEDGGEMADILCAEGRYQGSDRWVRLVCSRRELYVADTFVASQLALHVSEKAERMQNLSRIGSYEWERPLYSIAYFIRPNWTGVEIAPDAFPPPKDTSAPDRLAYDFRAKKAAEKIPKHKRPNGWAGDPNWWTRLES